MKLYFYFFLALLFVQCGSIDESDSNAETNSSTSRLLPGNWVFQLNLGDAILPFNAKVVEGTHGLQLNILNDTEIIEVTEVRQKDDSVWFVMPVFDSEFVGVVLEDGSISGQWNNYIKGDYQMPFVAYPGEETRFEGKHTNADIGGKWRVTFSPNTDDSTMAIGQFFVDDTHTYGTFLTETGDFRFLDGAVIDDELWLSCFDGSHAFLFNAVLNGDSLVDGKFWSGTHWFENWAAVRDSTFELRDPYAITYLNEGYKRMEFAFPDLSGDTVSIGDSLYDNKVVIVQIMGSWCPNCYDECKFYSTLYDQYHENGLEVVALCYEKSEKFEDATAVISKMVTNLNCQYKFLVAGYADKQRTSESLPMLNEVISYPTSVIIDKTGAIRNIHTGFYGPGTGDYYTRYIEEFTMLIEKLLAE